MTEKIPPEELRAHEDDILRGLLEAADRRQETTRIEIVRDGKVLFSFRIRPLEESEYNRCRDKATTYVRNRQLGIRLPETTDTARFRSYLIYEATVPEDRARVWDNKAAWERLGVLSGPDLIEKVLKAGEKAAIVDKIDEISGFSADLEETAKNSFGPAAGPTSSTTSSSDRG